MARPEAVAKALYYPTQDRILAMIAGIVRHEGPAGAALLDPCAGQGDAAAFLASRWGAVAHGVELHQGRADMAAAVLSWSRCGSYHQIQVVDDQGKRIDPDAYDPSGISRPFGILFLNPPYDSGADETGASMRQEIEFVRATSRYLAPGGLLIFIPPRKILRSEVFRDFMRAYYRSIEAYEYPHPEADEFDQVVVLAVRGNYQSTYGNVSALEDPDNLPSLEQAEPYYVTVPVRTARIEVVGRAPETYVPADNEGAWAGQQWIARTGDGATFESSPLCAPRPGHQAMLLAAGAINGLEIRAGRQRLLVKGGSSKTKTEIVNDDETIVRERITSYLSVLNLRTGALDSWQVEEDQGKTADWFRQHGDDLAAGILAAHAPQFTPADLARYDFAKLRAPGILPGRTEPEILQVQREASAAVVHRWRNHKEVIVCGEMGVGKSTIGVVACELLRSRKTVIVCPTHLLRKWGREIEAITGRRGCVVIPRKPSDVDRFFATDTATHLVLSKETAKLGARWEPACARGVKLFTREVKRYDGPWGRREYTEIVTSPAKFDACPSCGGEVRRLDRQSQAACPTCEEPLWQSVPITAKGTNRWPLAAYIHDRYARRYTLVVDEAHQHAKGESDQARAVHQLLSGARKVLMMTGTLYGGRASSIFHLLYRVDPAFRRAYKQTDCATFVEHHGLFETVHKEEKRTSTYGYRKGNSGGRVREIPGMSPAMIPMLLPYTVFVKLHDLRMELPPYTEEVELVEPDAAVGDALAKFQSDLKAVLRQNPKALGAYLQACLGYPDRPDQDEEVYAVNEDGSAGPLLAEMSAITPDSYPKDDRLLAIVQAERALDRKVLVFFTQTKRRDARPRVRAMLESAGLRVVQLDASVDPEKREQWMRDRCDEGFDVMLTNGRLVETGLDLMFANTIVQYGIEYGLNSLRQSIRRSWRLGQTKPVRVIFMGYARTMQATATSLISRKMRAAELVDGDSAGGLAQFDVGGGNFLLELAHEALAQSMATPKKRAKR